MQSRLLLRTLDYQSRSCRKVISHVLCRLPRRSVGITSRLGVILLGYVTTTQSSVVVSHPGIMSTTKRAVLTMNPEAVVPKKIFRYVLKGVHFCSVQEDGCSLDDLIAYTHLKNQQRDRPEIVELMVRQATACLRDQGLLHETAEGNFQLNQQLLPAPVPSSNRHRHQFDNQASIESEFEGQQRRVESTQEETTAAMEQMSPGPRDQDEQLNLDPDARTTTFKEQNSPSSDDENPDFNRVEQPSKRLMKRMGKGIELPNHRQHQVEPEPEPEAAGPSSTCEVLPELTELPNHLRHRVEPELEPEAAELSNFEVLLGQSEMPPNLIEEATEPNFGPMSELFPVDLSVEPLNFGIFDDGNL